MVNTIDGTEYVCGLNGWKDCTPRVTHMKESGHT